MSFHSYMRLACIAAVIVVTIMTDSKTMFTVILALGLAHYLIAVVYSRRQILAALRRTETTIKAAGVMGVSLLMYLAKTSLFWVFGVHHVLNEVYVTDTGGRPGGSDERSLRRIRFARVLVNGLVYLFLLRLALLSSRTCDLVLLGMLASYAYLMAAIFTARPLLSARQIIDACLLELVSIPLVLISFAHRVSFIQIVLYHFLIWTVYPLPKIRQEGRAAFATYVLLSTAVFVCALAISPLNQFGPHLAKAQFTELFFFLSYFHTGTSLFTSRAQPDFINEFFGLKAKNAAEIVPARTIMEPALTGQV